MRKNILFDLDGTLTDPGEGITNSVAYALAKYGIAVPDRAALYPFIGPPLYRSFMKYYGFPEEEALRAVEVYREYFRDKGMFENRVYPGIPGMLETLRKEGCRLFVATSKPEAFSETILAHFDLRPYFDGVCGATMDGARIEKADVIRTLLKTEALDARDCVMVGDREHDVRGAAACGIPAVGVLYGYGNREELERAGAKAIAGDVLELEQQLLTFEM